MCWYTRDYWLSDIEMVPHLATVDKTHGNLLAGPDLKQYFDACFEVLGKKGWTSTRINYQSPRGPTTYRKWSHQDPGAP